MEFQFANYKDHAISGVYFDNSTIYEVKNPFLYKNIPDNRVVFCLQGDKHSIKIWNHPASGIEIKTRNNSGIVMYHNDDKRFQTFIDKDAVITKIGNYVEGTYPRFRELRSLILENKGLIFDNAIEWNDDEDFPELLLAVNEKNIERKRRNKEVYTTQELAMPTSYYFCVQHDMSERAIKLNYGDDLPSETLPLTSLILKTKASLNTHTFLINYTNVSGGKLVPSMAISSLDSNGARVNGFQLKTNQQEWFALYASRSARSYDATIIEDASIKYDELSFTHHDLNQKLWGFSDLVIYSGDLSESELERENNDPNLDLEHNRITHTGTLEFYIDKSEINTGWNEFKFPQPDALMMKKRNIKWRVESGYWDKPVPIEMTLKTPNAIWSYKTELSPGNALEVMNGNNSLEINTPLSEVSMKIYLGTGPSPVTEGQHDKSFSLTATVTTY